MVTPTPIQPGQKHRLTVEKLTYGGSGLSHIEGIAVFIPDTIPGQEVEVEIMKAKGNFCEAKVLKLLKKSRDEVPARCKHFHECGGCTWQNLPYMKQLDYKEEIVRETLMHLTPVASELRAQLPGRVLKIIPSPQVFHYRNKLELSFGFASMRSEEQQGRRIYFDEDPTIDRKSVV